MMMMMMMMMTACSAPGVILVDATGIYQHSALNRFGRFANTSPDTNHNTNSNPTIKYRCE